MAQQITVQTTNAMILKGIKDLSDMLYRQTDIKPECYLPILQYLHNFARPLTQDQSTDQNAELKQSATVDCDNYEIHANIEKVKKILYRQTVIRPEVYLILFAELDKYDNFLKKQEMMADLTNQEQDTEVPPKKENKFAGLKKLFN